MYIKITWNKKQNEKKNSTLITRKYDFMNKQKQTQKKQTNK